MTPFLITKSHKDVGIAILLTFLFGPLGLFYASVTGGLIMLFTPIFLLLLLVVGIAQDNSDLIGWSFGLILIFALTYWIVCMIWAILSIRSYNKEIDEDAKRQFEVWNTYHSKDQSQVVVNIAQSDSKTIGPIEISTKPNLQDWLKNNHGKSINDYFSKYGR